MRKELTKKQQIINKLAEFFQKFRIIFLVLTIAVILGIVAVGVVGEIQKNTTKKSAEAFFKLEKAYQEWQMKDAEAMKASIQDMVINCDALSDQFGGTYAGEKAVFYKAEAYYQIGEYASAAEAYVELYDKNKNGLLAPSALYNSAVAYEQMNEQDKAAEYYGKLAEKFHNTSPLVPHALLNAGRVYSGLGKKEEALAAFNRVIEEYPSSSWTNLARTSIIQLK